MDLQTVGIINVAREVRKLAAERPDHVYDAPAEGGVRSCNYLTDASGKPGTGCIVGQALLRLGVEIPADKVGAGVYDLRMVGEGATGLEYDTEVWLREVQTTQDGGGRWGYAVERADSIYPKVAEATAG